jgi:hypothetical protein
MIKAGVYVVVVSKMYPASTGPIASKAKQKGNIKPKILE